MSRRRIADADHVAPELKGWIWGIGSGHQFDGDPSRYGATDLPPSDAEDEVFYWMDLEIGMPDSDAANLFRTCVATPRGLHTEVGRRQRPRKGRPPPIVVNPYSWESVFAEIQRRLESCSGPDWDSICEALRHRFHWEYDNYR